jgi:hypothetical protein
MGQLLMLLNALHLITVLLLWGLILSKIVWLKLVQQILPNASTILNVVLNFVIVAIYKKFGISLSNVLLLDLNLIKN